MTTPLPLHVSEARAPWALAETGPATLSVVVLPGRGDTPALYERLSSRLAVDGYRVAVLDWDPAVVPDLHALTAQLEELDGETGGKGLILVGSDAGAQLALALAANSGLPVKGLVLSGAIAEEAPATASWDAEVDLRAKCRLFQARLRETPEIRRGTFTGAQVPSQLLDLARPEAVQAPVLLLRGELDGLGGAPEYETLAARFPRAEVVELRASAHDVLNDRTNRVVAARIVEFIEWARSGDLETPIARTWPATRPSGL